MLKVMFCILLACQIVFWRYTKHIVPMFTITPNPPSKSEVQLLSMGDEQFLYRKLAFTLQNAGNKLGHYSSMQEYDYSKLYNWFVKLSDLDLKSRYVPDIATRYYAISRNEADVRKICEFLMYDYGVHGNAHWESLFNAAYLYYSKAKDASKVIELSKQLILLNDVPLLMKYFGIGANFQNHQYCAVLELARFFDYKHEKDKLGSGDINLRLLDRMRDVISQSKVLCRR